MEYDNLILNLQTKCEQAESELQEVRERLELAQRQLGSYALANVVRGINPPTPESQEDYLRRHGIHFKTDCFVVALLSPDYDAYLREKHLSCNYQNLSKVDELVGITCSKYLDCIHTTVEMRFVLVVPVKDMDFRLNPEQANMAVKYCNDRLSLIVQELKATHHIPCTAAISLPVKWVNSLAKAYDNASALLENCTKEQYIISNDIGFNNDRCAPPKINALFFWEQLFYIACIDRQSIQACQYLVSWLQQARSSIRMSFLVASSIMRHNLLFLLNKMDINIYEVTSELGADLTKCYLGIYSCTSFDQLEETLKEFSATVTLYTDMDIQKNASRSQIDMIECYIQAHFTEPDLTVERICNQFMLSRTAISKSFKEKTGSTILRAINSKRVEYAKQLIAEAVSFEEVAAASGFYSRRTLTEVFKKYAHITPREYRTSLKLHNTDRIKAPDAP